MNAVSPTGPDYDELRRRHATEAMAQMPEHVARLDWTAAQIQTERELRLQRLLAFARARSPWHRARLAGVDLTTLTPAGLGQVPPMTKDDLLGHFDEIVTDPRLTLGVVEAHLQRLTGGDAYLLEEYHAIASGGSSGRRGVYVYDWTGWSSYFQGIARRGAYDRLHDPALAAAPAVEAVVAAEKPTHGSSAQGQTFSNPQSVIVRVPITLPIEEVVSRLNQIAPSVLRGYPSALDQLGYEATAGRLRIAPLRIRGIGEPMLPETRARLLETFGVPVHNQWIASEAGCLGYSCLTGPGMHLNDDLVIVEPVDPDGRPVPPGQRSAKIYVTNLFNHALPLIRFEITDEVTVMDRPCPCGCAHTWIEDVQGRLDDSLIYPGIGGGVITVHPIVLRSPLGRQPNIADYQIHQTPRGIQVLLRALGEVDLDLVQAEIVAGLVTVGLSAPQVVLTLVDHLDRQATGKLKRFIPLP